MRHAAFILLLVAALPAAAAWDTPVPLLVVESEASDVLWQGISDAVWVNGRLIVTDYSLSRLVAFGPERNRAVVLAETGEGPGLVRNPFSVTRDPDGNVVATSESFGKCDVFGPDDVLRRSHHIYGAGDHPFCMVIRAEWRDDTCFAYRFGFEIDDGRIMTEYVIDRLAPGKPDSVLFRCTAPSGQERIDETAEPPFHPQGWLAAPDGGLWCSLDRDRASATDLLTGEVVEVPGLEPCRVSPDSLAARRRRLLDTGRYQDDDLRLLDTLNVVQTVLWDQDLTLLCRVENGEEFGRLVMAYPGQAGRVEPFTRPVPDAEGALYLVADRTFAAVYDEEQTYTTAWGESVRGPCILVVRYEE